MELKSLYLRAKRGLREDPRLHLVATSSLTIAFFCLATALLGLTNLSELADRWGRTHHMSVYLRDDAPAGEVDRLRDVLRSLPALTQVEYVSPDAARTRFLKDADAGNSLSSLPVSAFPASLEVDFANAVGSDRIEQVAQKVAGFSGVVDQVDTYRSWFARLGSLLSARRLAAGLMSVLVLVCVLAVVSNTIRLSVAHRKDEIEMLRMCGATDGFVRGPFVVEGTLSGFAAAAAAVSLLVVTFLVLRPQFDAALSPLSGMKLSFLPVWMVLALLAAGALLGALGSAVSIRRYLKV